MRKEVTKISEEKDFVEEIEKKFGEKADKVWIFVKKSTLERLDQKNKSDWVDNKGKRRYLSLSAEHHITLEFFVGEDTVWYRIISISGTSFKPSKVCADPEEIIFIA